jgi:hypothetical protein
MAMTMTEKLNLKENAMVVLNAPEGALAKLGGELPGVTLTSGAPDSAGAVLLYVNSLDEAARLSPEAVGLVRPGGLLWIAYPKGSSKVKTDVNRDRLWPVLEEIGWRPVRQVALDEVWSAMRFRPADEVGR